VSPEMEELLLINPSKRKRGKKMATRRRGHRTAAQKAATRRMLAARWGKPNPRRRHRRVSRSYAANPRRRSYRRNPESHATRARAARRGWSHRRRHHYRRNPSVRGNLSGLLMGSFQGALGAIGVDVIYNFIPLPATMKTGNMQYIAKGVVAIGLGMLIRNRMVSKMVEGSLTVTMYNAVKNLAGGMIPGLSGLGYYPGGAMVASAVPSTRPAPALSEYVNMPGMHGLNSVDEYVHY
jgi:hypothetical protein